LASVAAILLFILMASIISPSLYALRYVCVLIPFVSMLIAISLIRGIRKKWLAASFLFLFLFTDLFSLPFLLKPKSYKREGDYYSEFAVNSRFPFLGYLFEIHHYFPRAYDAGIELLENNVKKDQVINVIQNHNFWPLIYYLGDRYKFCCQLSVGTHLDYQVLKSKLPAYIFVETSQPDYLLAFGKDNIEFKQSMDYWRLKGIDFELIDEADIFYDDGIAPEFNFRFFYPIRDVDFNIYGIYLYKRKKLE